MSFRILGLGTALPPHLLDQTEAALLGAEVCCRTDQQARLLAVLYRNAGVETRHTVLPAQIALEFAGRGSGAVATATNGRGPTTAERMRLFAEHAPPLARAASAAALRQADLPASSVTHLITVTCTGFAAPGVDVDLIHALGLPATVERIQVGFMGCHGAINALRVAQALAAADARARILLCAVELSSLHYQFEWDPETCIGNALFADGAAAVVGRGATLDATADTAVAFGRNGRGHREWRLTATGSRLLPDSTDAMSWRIGDYGFEMTLTGRVPRIIAAHLRPWLGEWLERQGLTIAEIGCWAVHPGGPRIVAAVAEALTLPPQAVAVSHEVLSECGNMSSPTVLFVIDRLRQRQAPLPCLALAFGPGLTAEVALWR